MGDRRGPATLAELQDLTAEIAALVELDPLAVDDPREIVEAAREQARMAAIGRAVVDFAFPGDPRAARQATPERVVDWFRRTRDELRSLETCDALHVGRLALELSRALWVPRGA